MNQTEQKQKEPLSIEDQVNQILQDTAPIAASTLRNAVKSGHNLKKDKAYEAALEVLDRTGHGKQTQTTVHHEGIPELPPNLIAGALSVLAKMFDKEDSLATSCQKERTVTSSWEPVQSTPLESIEDEEQVPKEKEESSSYSSSDIPFEIDPEVL